MSVAELLTYLKVSVRIVEMSDEEGESVVLYHGRYEDIPNELRKREVLSISGSERRVIRICLTPDGK